MIIINTAQKMSAFAEKSIDSGHSIGFVPTMGALHAGHRSLMKVAKQQTDIVVVSIFVNPNQFNSKEDLEKYPRTIEADQRLLTEAAVDVLFYPDIEQIYPNKEKRTYNLEGLDKYMEGSSRPGHFNGVVQVVTRLFDIVQPKCAFFGEKDFQQLAIIKLMGAQK